MKLDRVTITGADDSVSPQQLSSLSAEFPFAEWAILFSPRHVGTPRWPSFGWLSQLHAEARATGVLLSAHLCGGHMRSVLQGEFIEGDILDLFQRIQLNFHAEPQQVLISKMIRCLEAMRISPSDRHWHRQFIFQIDGVNDWIFQQARQESQMLDLVPLFDGSHGAGRLPGHWPKAEYCQITPDKHKPLIYHGYAGGLGPDNLESELMKIADAAGNSIFWIDMETRVRSDDDRVFDLAKVRRCLEICRPFVTQ